MPHSPEIDGILAHLRARVNFAMPPHLSPFVHSAWPRGSRARHVDVVLRRRRPLRVLGADFVVALRRLRPVLPEQPLFRPRRRGRVLLEARVLPHRPRHLLRLDGAEPHAAALAAVTPAAAAAPVPLIHLILVA